MIRTPRIAPAALRLMLVTDRDLAVAGSLDAIVAAAVEGGVTSVQLREKTASTREFIALAKALENKLGPLGVALFVNDRVDVALAAGIAGAHVGQSDMRPAEVRALMGERAAIGLSITAIADLRPEDLAAVDYLGVGPIFATGTKPDATAPLGLDGLGAIRRLSDLPIVAIGGISAENAGAVIAAGADGVAVVSAIMAAADPAEAARRLRRAMAGAA